MPEELPPLIEVLPSISILRSQFTTLPFCPKYSDDSRSPNAGEALGLLSIPLPVTRVKVEEAAAKFLGYGVGEGGQGSVIIRSGALGAYVVSRTTKGRWVEAFWGPNDLHHVVDVTGTPNPDPLLRFDAEYWTKGAGNAFLGGLGAGLKFTQDIYEGEMVLGGAVFPLTRSAAVLYASVSASFVIEQEGLPLMEPDGASWRWNGDSPQRRLTDLRNRSSH